jgi:hypothetical protein
MLPLPVTISTTAIFVLMLTGLSLLVSLRRKDLNLLSGDGDDRILRRRIRTHGNFIENAPLIVFLVLSLEAVLTTSSAVWGVAAILVLSRILHAIGSLKRSKPLIAPAMVIQHLTLLICGVWLLIQVYQNVLGGM